MLVLVTVHSSNIPAKIVFKLLSDVTAPSLTWIFELNVTTTGPSQHYL